MEFESITHAHVRFLYLSSDDGSNQLNITRSTVDDSVDDVISTGISMPTYNTLLFTGTAKLNITNTCRVVSMPTLLFFLFGFIIKLHRQLITNCIAG